MLNAARIGVCSVLDTDAPDWPDCRDALCFLVFGVQEDGPKSVPLVNHNWAPPPCFFVSIDSRGFRSCVNRLESTLAGSCVNVDSK